MIGSLAFPSAIYIVVFSASFWCWILFEIWVFLRERGTAEIAHTIAAAQPS